MRSCGVSFNIWKKANADGKGSGTFEFTSLLGNDKKATLARTPRETFKCPRVLLPVQS